jgi:colanic acid/amylovoran biosynthesis protein
MRLAITNTVALNGGDAAIALCLREALSSLRPTARVELHEIKPEVAQRYFPEVAWRPQLGRLLGPRIPLKRGREIGQQLQMARITAGLTDGTHGLASHWWRSGGEQAALRDFSELDAVVSTGGTYLVEQYPLLARIFEYEVTLQLGIPLIFYTQSLGPFAPRYRSALKRILSEAKLVLLRDERSAQYLRTLGVSGDHVHVVADAVFSMAAANRDFPSRRDPGEPWKIGASVRQWPVGASLSHPRVRSYVSAMATGLAELVVELPAEVELISTCQGIPEYWIDDSAVARAIVEEVEPALRGRFKVDHGFHSPSAFRERVSRFDLFVATRMHAAILSLTAGTPVLPIAYEFKTRELFTRLGMEDYVLDIDNLSAAALSRTTGQLARGLEDQRNGLATAVAAEREQAYRAIELLDSAIDP